MRSLRRAALAALASTSLLLPALPAAACPVTPPPVPTEAATAFGWGPVKGGDEFAYTGAPDPKKWSVYKGAGHAGKGRREPSAWAVDGSVARVTGNAQGITGGMSGKFDRDGKAYGRWEVRMRVPSRDPQYHAVNIIWPDAGRTSSTNCQEIDFSEATSSLTANNFFLHYDCSGGQSYAKQTIDLSAWHTYAVDWQPGTITGYVDGVKWFEDSTNARKVKAPGHITLQLDWFPKAGVTPKTSTVEWDWVRWYDRP